MNRSLQNAQGTPIKADAYQIVTDLILGHLEQGVVPWRCPWNREIGRPRNFHTGKPYRGVNVILLGCCNATSPWWMTFQQAIARGGHVRKGEHGAPVVKYGTFETKADENRSSEEKRPNVRRFLRVFKVFNASQIEGIQFPASDPVPLLSSDQRIEKAEAIAMSMPDPPRIREASNARALYRPSIDEIEMPAFSQFESGESYYLTLYHELAHATGHSSRLNRESLTGHDGLGGKVYSQEELVAEMCAAFLAMEAGIVTDRHEQSAAYLHGWLSVLKVTNHQRWIAHSSTQASRAADYILGRPETTDPSNPSTD